IYACGYHFLVPGGGYHGLLTRLPDPPALVRDIVALEPTCFPMHRLHTMGEYSVAARVVTGAGGFDQDDNNLCVVEFDPNAPANNGPG
ncbi:hypothetical protein, partial [Klebsiella pneumoniae]|uniref:hypothetical protein n=1 Tax=Klebsiella pneumoniae TaxID=573 RepID=UPI0025A25EF8